jgi:hypothetical protein
MLLLLLPLAAMPALADVYRAAIPASYWMKVQEVHVSDSYVNRSPRLEVAREIKKQFTASWIAEVHAKQDNGTFATVCTGNGENLYKPEDSLPINLDLDWWTYPKRCNLGPGTYRVFTVWKVEPQNYPTKWVENTSNVFQITDIKFN